MALRCAVLDGIRAEADFPFQAPSLVLMDRPETQP